MYFKNSIFAGLSLLGLCFSTTLLADEVCQTSLISIDDKEGVLGYRENVNINVNVSCQHNWSKANLAVAIFYGERVSKPATHLSGFSTYPISSSQGRQYQGSFPFTLYRDGVYVVRVEALLKDNPTFDDFDKNVATEFYAFARSGYVTYSLNSPEDARLKHNAANDNGRRSRESDIANSMGGVYVPSSEDEMSRAERQAQEIERRKNSRHDNFEGELKSRDSNAN